MEKIFLTVLVASAFIASTFSLAIAATYNVSSKTVADINTIYYLIGDDTVLQKASALSSKVKFIPTGDQSGFEDIDIIVDGSVEEKYTLVFGVSPITGSSAEKCFHA